MTFAQICALLDLDPTDDDNAIVSLLAQIHENQARFDCSFLPDVRQHAIIGGFVRSDA